MQVYIRFQLLVQVLKPCARVELAHHHIPATTNRPCKCNDLHYTTSFIHALDIIDLRPGKQAQELSLQRAHVLLHKNSVALQAKFYSISVQYTSNPSKKTAFKMTVFELGCRHVSISSRSSSVLLHARNMYLNAQVKLSCVRLQHHQHSLWNVVVLHVLGRLQPVKLHNFADSPFLEQIVNAEVQYLKIQIYEFQKWRISSQTQLASNKHEPRPMLTAVKFPSEKQNKQTSNETISQ